MNLHCVARATTSALLGAILAAVATTPLAQDKLDKPVKILVGFAAGGTADLTASGNR
jgi:tripartite-type tricarboxylate transporter receptor subunit TctC